MKLLRQIIEAISFWIDSVAATINSIFERTRSHRRVRLVENEIGAFTLHLVDGGKNSNLPDQRVEIANGSLVRAFAAKMAIDRCAAAVSNLFCSHPDSFFDRLNSLSVLPNTLRGSCGRRSIV